METNKVLTKEEIYQLWNATETDQERTMLRTMMECGPRLGELTNKTGARSILVSTALTDMLQELAQGDVIWTNDRGDALTMDGMGYRFRKLLRRAGFTDPGLGAHIMRRTFAVHFLRNGGNVMALAKILGFSSAMTVPPFLDRPLSREDMPPTSLADDLDQNDS